MRLGPRGRIAVNWVELTNVVWSADPFHSTEEPDTKLVPLTVMVNDGAPAGAEFGDRLVTVGPPEVEPCPKTGARKATVDPGVKTPGAQTSFKYQWPPSRAARSWGG